MEDEQKMNAWGWSTLFQGPSDALYEQAEKDSEYSRPTPKLKARLLYDHCVSSNNKVSESVHSLYIVGEHYSADDPVELTNPEIINGIPTFFPSLTKEDKADFCYNQVIEALSAEAQPVTVASLIATTRRIPGDPNSSPAGRFVRRVTRCVMLSLALMFTIFLFDLMFFNFLINTNDETKEVVRAIHWVAFGCIGALVHLLNHALTTTRLKTFETSDERKIGPRLLLGGMFGYVIPWLIKTANPSLLDDNVALGSVAAFFGGYSVRFAIGLIERLLEAVFPETRK